MWEHLIRIANDLEGNKMMWGLIAVVVFDYLTGMAKAYAWKVQDSQVGMKGLIKHGFVLLAFMFVYPFAGAFGVANMVDIFVFLYILNYLISILENFGVMGIYVPKFLENKIKSEIARYEEQLATGQTAKQLGQQSVNVTVDNSAVIQQLMEREQAFQNLKASGAITATTPVGDVSAQITEALNQQKG